MQTNAFFVKWLRVIAEVVLSSAQSGCVELEPEVFVGNLDPQTRVFTENVGDDVWVARLAIDAEKIRQPKVAHVAVTRDFHVVTNIKHDAWRGKHASTASTAESARLGGLQESRGAIG